MQRKEELSQGIEGKLNGDLRDCKGWELDQRKGDKELKLDLDNPGEGVVEMKDEEEQGVSPTDQEIKKIREVIEEKGNLGYFVRPFLGRDLEARADLRREEEERKRQDAVDEDNGFRS